MGKTAEKPKRHIISVRVDDKMMSRLNMAGENSGMSRSELLLAGVKKVVRKHGGHRTKGCC